MQPKIITLIGMTFLSVLLSACHTNPKEAYRLYQPKTLPVRNITHFHQSLQCFDNLLVKANIKPIYITSEGIPNHAGKTITLLSGRDMLINTISQLESNVFKFINLPSLPSTQLLEQLGISKSHPSLFEEYLKTYNRWNKGKKTQKRINYPDYMIIGAITQADKNIISGGASASVSLRDADFGVSKDDMVSVISLDMNIVNTANFEVLNGVGSSNSIAIYRQGIAGDLGGRIKNSGVFLNFSFDESEGMHQAIRTLIQLNTLEVLGKLAKVPYTDCLKPTYDRTETLKNKHLAAAQSSITSAAKPLHQHKASIDVKITLPKQNFQLNDVFSVKATVSENAHVHCFYQNHKGSIWKIFPNKHQTSDYIIANQPVNVIQQKKAHEIALSMNNVKEQVMCLAARDKLVTTLSYDNLIPTNGALSFSSLQQIADSYQQKTATRLSQEIVSIQVL
jgi:curli biogenesis system outer membrane secretion channel CsgG